MRRPVRSAALVLPLLLLLAVGVLSAQPAELRAINLLQGSGPIDLFAADTMQPRVMNLESGGASFVLSMAPGTTQVVATPSGQRNQRILTTSAELMAGERINLLLLGVPAVVDPVQLGFTQPEPASPDSVYIRIYQAAPALGSASYTLMAAGAPDATIQSSSYKSVTTFVALPRGNVRLKVTGSGSSSVLADVFTEVPGGTYATFFITGAPTDLKVVMLRENNGGPQQPMPALTATPVTPVDKARVRLVNVLGGINQARLSVLGSSTPIVSGVNSGGASGFGAIEARMLTLALSAPSRPTETPFVYSYPANSFTTVFWVDTAVSASMLVIDKLTSTTVTPGDSVDVRVIDASRGGDPTSAYLQDAYFERHLLTFSSEGISDGFRLPAGRIVLKVRDADSGGADYQATATLAGGTAVDLVLFGEYGTRSFTTGMLRRYDTLEQPVLPLMTRIGSGYLRIVNVAPPPPADSLSIYLVGSNEEPLVLKYLAAGPSSEAIPATPFHLSASANDAPQSSPILDLPVQVRADTLSTWAILRGEGASPLRAIELVHTPFDAPASGKFALRFVHASPDAGPIDITIRSSDGASVKVENLGYASKSVFSQLLAGKITVTITRSQSGDELARLEGNINEGAVVNAFIVGMTADNTLGVRLDDETKEDGAVPMPALTPVTSSAVPGHALAGASELVVKPNPASRIASISRASIPSDVAMVVLLDPLGVQVAGIPVGLAGAAGDLSLPVADLAAGCYGVQLRRADGTIAGATRVVVIR